MEFTTVSANSYDQPGHYTHMGEAADAYPPQDIGHVAHQMYPFHYDYFSANFSQYAYSHPAYIHPEAIQQYSFPPAPQSVSPPTAGASAPEIPLHAPVPLSGFSSLITPIVPIATAVQPPSAPEQSHAQIQPETTASPSHSDAVPPLPLLTAPAPVSAEQNPLEYYGSAPHGFFPTPSELLTELNERQQVTGAVPQCRRNVASTFSSDTHTAATRAPKKSKTLPENPVPPKQPETQRKAYFRAVAEGVGFTPTDPDTITSHDKKRSYLECLEEYVQYIHDQIRLACHEPIPLERITTYPGLNSRSVRTMLVHMQDVVRELHMQASEEESEYVNLHMQASLQRAAADAQQLRRHSIASCGVSDTTSAMSMQPFLQPVPPPSNQAQLPVQSIH